eukprot:6368625-Prymnesium_polylepis.2
MTTPTRMTAATRHEHTHTHALTTATAPAAATHNQRRPGAAVARGRHGARRLDCPPRGEAVGARAVRGLPGRRPHDRRHVDRRQCGRPGRAACTGMRLAAWAGGGAAGPTHKHADGSSRNKKY